MRDPDRYLAQLFGLSEVLASRHGWPALSPWWRETLADAERSGVRQRVIRKGRRIGASTIVAPIVAVTEAFHGEHAVPPNDVGFFLFFSVKKDEAAKRLRGIATVLDALGKKYREAGDTIELLDRPIAFKVSPASFRTAVGDTSIGIWCDEVSRWLDAESGANPATEVLASVRPTLATMPNGRIWLVSSPLGTTDAHAAAFDAGDSAGQRVYFCPTWVGNPTLSEAQTHELEPDERLWRREWAAQPQASLSSAFDPDGVEAAFRTVHIGSFHQPIGVVDASSGGGDAFTYATISYGVQLPPADVEPWLYRHEPRVNNCVTKDGQPYTYLDHNDLVPVPVRDARGNHLPSPEYLAAQIPILCVQRVDAFEGRFAGSISGSEIVERIAKSFKRDGVQTVVGDQRESFFLGSEFSRYRLHFVPLTWTNPSKIEAVTLLKRKFAERTLSLPDRPKLRRELASYAERITASGSITYSARGTGHDDEVALLVTAAMAELERLIPGSPFASNQRSVVSGR